MLHALRLGHAVAHALRCGGSGRAGRVGLATEGMSIIMVDGMMKDREKYVWELLHADLPPLTSALMDT